MILNKCYVKNKFCSFNHFDSHNIGSDSNIKKLFFDKI